LHNIWIVIMIWEFFSRLFSLGQKGDGEIDEDYWIIPMSLHRLNYRGEDYTVPRYGRLDPGSEVNLVSERILDELNYPYYHKVGALYILGNTLRTVGDMTLKWHVAGKPDQVYTSDFTVIARDVPLTFDFLLGRGWCKETKALIKNPEVLCLEMP
jgi:hypothetical protein